MTQNHIQHAMSNSAPESKLSWLWQFYSLLIEANTLSTAHPESQTILSLLPSLTLCRELGMWSRLMRPSLLSQYDSYG